MVVQRLSDERQTSFFASDAKRLELTGYEEIMALVRFLMLLSLVIWVGGIVFFAFVLAPTVFHPGILPSRQLAGAVVSRSLGILHTIGLTCGVVFLVTSMIDSQVMTGFTEPFAGRNLLVYAMIALTLVSMFAISTRMLALRNDMVFIDNIPHGGPRRVEFNRLHEWSTRLEGAVLLLGLVVIFLTSRRLS
jgi:hypothetical protein